MSNDSCLWHYTDAAGLYGIVNSKALRFSHSWFLNDTTERTFGTERVAECIDAEITRLGAIPNLTALQERWQRRIDRRDEFFTVSLSESSDALSQWQRYGLNGRGFCIGFSMEALAKHCVKSIDLRKMRYAHDAQRERFRELLTWYIDDAAQLYTVSPKYTDHEVNDLRAAYLVGVLDAVFLEFKNPRFEDEREWRLIRQVPDILGEQDPEVSFAPRGDVVKPYIEIPFTRLLSDSRAVERLLRTVICGPQLDPDLAVSSTRRFMTASGFCDLDIRPSELRGIWR